MYVYVREHMCVCLCASVYVYAIVCSCVCVCVCLCARESSWQSPVYRPVEGRGRPAGWNHGGGRLGGAIVGSGGGGAVTRYSLPCRWRLPARGHGSHDTTQPNGSRKRWTAEPILGATPYPPFLSFLPPSPYSSPPPLVYCSSIFRYNAWVP